jgi:hypothetical protein
MSEGAMLHDFSFIKGRNEREEREKKNVGVKECKRLERRGSKEETRVKFLDARIHFR